MLQIVALVIGVLATFASIFGYRQNPAAFYHAYLIVFLYLLGFALGPIGILGLQYITGGRWGRRDPPSAGGCREHAAADGAAVHSDRARHARALRLDARRRRRTRHGAEREGGYLNERFFLIRAVIYFVVWIGASYFLCRLSHQQDVEPGDAMDKKLQFLGRGRSSCTRSP
jgi:hypothetical protein